MNQSNQQSGSTFVELGSAPLPKQTANRHEGNIFKNIQASSIQFSSFSENNQSECEPVVSIQRDGDKIESIEFVCSCGKSKTLTFDYDDN